MVSAQFSTEGFQPIGTLGSSMRVVSASVLTTRFVVSACSMISFGAFKISVLQHPIRRSRSISFNSLIRFFVCVWRTIYINGFIIDCACFNLANAKIRIGISAIKRNTIEAHIKVFSYYHNIII